MNKSKLIATKYYKIVTLIDGVSNYSLYISPVKLPLVTKRRIRSCAKCCKICC